MPAHVGLTENENADELVKKGRKEPASTNVAELSDITSIIEKKVKQVNSVEFEWKTPVAKMNVDRSTSTSIVRLQSKRRSTEVWNMRKMPTTTI